MITTPNPLAGAPGDPGPAGPAGETAAGRADAAQPTSNIADPRSFKAVGIIIEAEYI
jgi:hypothetical protein